MHSATFAPLTASVLLIARMTGVFCFPRRSRIERSMSETGFAASTTKIAASTSPIVVVIVFTMKSPSLFLGFSMPGVSMKTN